MTLIHVTRRIEFDAGHRIPDHKSKCRNVHGHRYALEATVAGSPIRRAGASDNGMVLDFGDLKEIMQREIGDPWDHGFLVFERDAPLLTLLHALGANHNTVVLPFVPTVENLVEHAFIKLSKALDGGAEVGWRLLQHVRLYETPNCWADRYRSNS